VRYCTHCQHEISAERLEVLPDTTICSKCIKQKEYVKPVVRKEVLDPQPYIEAKIPYVKMFERKSTIILGRSDPVIPSPPKAKEILVDLHFYVDNQWQKTFGYKSNTICKRYPITSDIVHHHLQLGHTFSVRDGVLWIEHEQIEPIQIGKPIHQMIVYKTTNTVNGKIYVGQDSKNNPRYLGSGNVFKEALHQYGKEHFVKEILEVCDPYYMLTERDRQRLLNEREEYWITKLRARNPTIGYNLSNPYVTGTRADHRTNKLQAKIDHEKQLVQQPKKISRRTVMPTDDIADL